MKPVVFFITSIAAGFALGAILGVARDELKPEPTKTFSSSIAIQRTSSSPPSPPDAKPRMKTHPASAVTTPPLKAELPASTWVPQTFNNCVPATTSMVLQHFGNSVGQNEIKQDLRTNPDDKNVFIDEMSVYLGERFDIEAKVRFNGTLDKLKLLVANGVYVVLENWLHPNEDIGHAILLRGYDDEKGILIADDSYLGKGTEFPYEEFVETQWKPFNFEYMPVYRKEKEELVKAVIGEEWDDRVMFRNAVARHLEAIARNESDVYAWFNLGSGYFGLGEYLLANNAFERAQAIGWPKRMLWYHVEPVQTKNKIGEYSKALELVGQALWANNSFAEAHLEAAIAWRGLGDEGKAKNEAKIALQFAPNLQKATDFLYTVE